MLRQNGTIVALIRLDSPVTEDLMKVPAQLSRKKAINESISRQSLQKKILGRIHHEMTFTSERSAIKL